MTNRKPTVDQVMAMIESPEARELPFVQATIARRLNERLLDDGILSPIQAVPGVRDFSYPARDSDTPPIEITETDAQAMAPPAPGLIDTSAPLYGAPELVFTYSDGRTDGTEAALLAAAARLEARAKIETDAAAKLVAGADGFNALTKGRIALVATHNEIARVLREEAALLRSGRTGDAT